MTSSIFRDISAAWLIAVKRSKTANLAVGGPAMWENDFFVNLSKKEPWEGILRDVQAVLPNADPAEINEVFFFTLSKQLESSLKDETARISFRDNLSIEIEKFIPLDDKESELVEKAKTLLQFPGADSVLDDADYEIADISGTECSDPDIISRTRIALEIYLMNDKGGVSSRDEIPKGSLTAADISIMRSALSNGRFEAAWNLVISKQFPRDIPKLRYEGASFWVRQVSSMLKNHSAAVEKERRRLTTRLFFEQNCKKLFPSCLTFFSKCVLLRIERADRINKIKELGNAYRNHFEEDLKLLDAALGISEGSIIETGYILWLKKEYYNRVHEAEIENLGAWIKNNKDAVSLAVAERLIQTHPDIKKILQDVYTVVDGMRSIGDIEKGLLENARESFKGAESEVKRKDGLIIQEINRDPAPAA